MQRVATIEFPRLGHRSRTMLRAALLAFVALFMLATILLVVFVKAYRVTSGSMEPTALIGQRILADHLHDAHWTPRIGNVIIFNPPAGAADNSLRECAVPRQPGTACTTPIAGTTGTSFVKRVVGLPGDTLSIVHGHVIRNGRPEAEPFKGATCDEEICNLEPFVVPAGDYYVMGDNRGNSDDSRFWGPVPRAQIIGHVFGSYWPLSRFGPI
jgi:signal peptidase I